MFISNIYFIKIYLKSLKQSKWLYLIQFFKIRLKNRKTAYQTKNFHNKKYIYISYFSRQRDEKDMYVVFWKVGRLVIVFWPFSLNLNAHLSTQVQCIERNSKTEQNKNPKYSRKNNDSKQVEQMTFKANMEHVSSINKLSYQGKKKPWAKNPAGDTAGVFNLAF